MSEKEEQVESKEAPHLVNMELSTILSMVNRVSKEYVDAESKAPELASALTDKELFNLFFALEFLFKSEEGIRSQKDLADENSSLFLYAVIIREIEIRTGLPYNSNHNFITTL